jgi:hypothetical protein
VRCDAAPSLLLSFINSPEAYAFRWAEAVVWRHAGFDGRCRVLMGRPGPARAREPGGRLEGSFWLLAQALTRFSFCSFFLDDVDSLLLPFWRAVPWTWTVAFFAVLFDKLIFPSRTLFMTRRATFIAGFRFSWTVSKVLNNVRFLFHVIPRYSGDLVYLAFLQAAAKYHSPLFNILKTLILYY